MTTDEVADGDLADRPRLGATGPAVVSWLSALWPGLGHWRTARNAGRTLAVAAGVLAAVAVAILLRAERNELVVWSLNRRVLITIIVAASVTLAFRLIVLADAVRRARSAATSDSGASSRPRRVASIAAIVASIVFVTAPHAVAIVYASAQLDFLTTVFTAEDTVTAQPSPLPGVTSTTAPADVAPTTDAASSSTTSLPAGAPGDTTPPAPTTSTTAESPASTVPSTTAPPTTTEPPRATWDGEPRLTIALLGGDGGFDRQGVRTDTIIVLSIDVHTGEAAAFNVPRNWQRMPFPEGTPAAEMWPRGYYSLANEIYNIGWRNPEAFPDAEDPSGQAIKSSLAQLTGLPIQYYVLVDMVGVVKAIDTLGGIDIEVTEWINDRIKPITPGGPHIDIVVSPGPAHLDGLTALGYVRARTTSSDYHRMTRQRCVIEALIDQTSPAELVGAYLTLTGIMKDHVVTDIPLDRLDDLLLLSRSLDTSNITTVNFIPPEFARGAAPVEDVRAAVAEALRGTEAEGNSSLAVACHRGDAPAGGAEDGQ